MRSRPENESVVKPEHYAPQYVRSTGEVSENVKGRLLRFMGLRSRVGLIPYKQLYLLGRLVLPKHESLLSSPLSPLSLLSYQSFLALPVLSCFCVLLDLYVCKWYPVCLTECVLCKAFVCVCVCLLISMMLSQGLAAKAPWPLLLCIASHHTRTIVVLLLFF